MSKYSYKILSLSVKVLLAVLLLLSPVLTFGQIPATGVRPILKISGKVVDISGTPIPGAAVRLKSNPTAGTSTNLEGEFSLNLSSGSEVLVVSFIGMKTREVAVNPESGASVRVVLEEDEAMIEDVVVTGYFTRPKEGYTGNASTFTAEDLKSIGNRNVLSSLQNLDPSFMITENLSMGSNPNSMPDIQIRGQSSLTNLQGDYQGNPNEPLFILDGFETTLEKIFDLDMNRVASVTLLKDAAAKALYGSKGANGVVVVETIVPREGELRVTYTGSLSIEAPDLSSYHLTNAAEKLQVELDAGRYTTTHPTSQQNLTEQYNAILSNVKRGVDTYWLAKPLRTGIGHKHSLYVEGGTESLRYGIDFSYNNTEGVMKGSNRQNTAGSINLSYRKGKLLFRNILSVNFNESNNSPYGSFSEYIGLNPYYTPYDENGNVQKLLGTFTDTRGTTTYYYNPLHNATLGTKDFTKYNEITENFYIEWQALRDLKFTGRLGYTHQSNSGEVFLPGDHTSFATWTGDSYYQRGSYTMTDGFSQSLSVDFTGNYTKKLGKHLFLANAAWSLSTQNAESHGFTAWGFLNNRVDNITFAKQYQENGTPTGTESIAREVGILGVGHYSYDNRYMLDLTVRSNASSVYGANNRWGTFWSTGVGWNIHNERAIKDDASLKFINQFKVRASVGSTGSQNFSPFQAMSTYKFHTSNLYDNISGAYLYALANDNLSWQETFDINIGTDIGLFDRFTMKFDYYISTTENLLIDFTLPPSTGFSTYKENLGTIENKGFDVTLNYQFFRSKDKKSFASVFASANHNKNKIKKISDALRKMNDEQDNQTDTTLPFTRYEAGQSTTAIWAVRSLGIDPTNGQEIFLTKDGRTTYIWNTDDQVVAGDSNPKLSGTFGFNAEYKGFGLNCYFYYTLGADYYNQTLVSRVENVDIADNVDYRVFSGTWKNPGDVTYFKRITTNPSITRPTTRFVEKKNELSLSSLNVYYDFKFHDLKKAKLERLKCTFYMNDLFVLSTVRTERGTSYPYARTFSFSVQATF